MLLDFVKIDVEVIEEAIWVVFGYEKTVKQKKKTTIEGPNEAKLH